MAERAHSLPGPSPLLLLLLVLLGCAAAPAFDEADAKGLCPRIVSRAEWKARKPLEREPLPTTPTPYVVVHHGGVSSYCQDQPSCSAIVRSYQNMHLDEHGWADIGYHFLVGEDGNVYEGRGWDLVGAHAPGYNGQGIGICLIGNFVDFLPNEAALRALRSLISCGVALDKLREDYSVIGHRQARNTECPGQALYEYVQRMPHWTDSPTPVPLNSSSG
ncbi:peptidoglycan recognition protein 1 isoform X2 [Nasonia vitripennis]|uniref:Peptidoglycan-recognition protein n=1 Tax=Nasonia vitripennis TaxID=7425 RepID=A0A7M7GF40_NASVI|nr:peptidoglycan recognition protein 1 isoform X2 [Nasonia vitripennis]